MPGPYNTNRDQNLGRTLLCSRLGDIDCVGCGLCLPKDLCGGVVRDATFGRIFLFGNLPVFPFDFRMSTNRKMETKIEPRITAPLTHHDNGAHNQHTWCTRKRTPQKIWSRLTLPRVVFREQMIGLLGFGALAADRPTCHFRLEKTAV